jgi:hypothetical protein
VAPGCLRWWLSICKTARGKPLRCGPRGRGAGTSEKAPLVACTTGTVQLRRVWANAGRGHAHAHVQRLPCSEVLQRRSLTEDGFEKGRIAGICSWGGTRISAECSASGARLSKTVWRLTRAVQTLWRFCSDECSIPQRRRGSARGRSLITGVQGVL